MPRKISAGCLALLLLLLLTACGNQRKVDSAAESQLYGTTESLFSDSYSMELWSLEEVVKSLSSLDRNVPEDVGYLRGRIDGILNSHSTYYLHLISLGQSNLSQPVLSQDLFQAISAYQGAEETYLKAVAAALTQDTPLPDGVLSNNTKLGGLLRELNRSVTDLDQEQEAKYITQLNETTALLTQVADTMAQ